MKEYISSLDFENDIYPQDIMDAAVKNKKPPKCIFVPTIPLLRSMIRAVVDREPNESETLFLLRFGLIQNKAQTKWDKKRIIKD